MAGHRRPHAQAKVSATGSAQPEQAPEADAHAQASTLTLVVRFRVNLQTKRRRRKLVSMPCLLRDGRALIQLNSNGRSTRIRTTMQQ